MKNGADSFHGNGETPSVAQLDRRGFLKYVAIGGGLAAIGATGMLTLRGNNKGSSSTIPSGYRTLRLSEHPSPNPAFRAKSLPNRELLVWTGPADAPDKAFVVNATGRQVWRMCDGMTSQDAIVGRCAQRTGHSPARVAAFLDELLACSIIVRGGTMVVPENFPGGPEVRSYVPILDEEATDQRT